VEWRFIPGGNTPNVIPAQVGIQTNVGSTGSRPAPMGVKFTFQFHPEGADLRFGCHGPSFACPCFFTPEQHGRASLSPWHPMSRPGGFQDPGFETPSPVLSSRACAKAGIQKSPRKHGFPPKPVPAGSRRGAYGNDERGPSLFRTRICVAPY
jgi:hypothetical protein